MATRKASTATPIPTQAAAKPSARPAAKARPAATRVATATLAQPQPQPQPQQPAPASAAKPAGRRPRLVRDGFTMPEDDFALIAALKVRSLSARRDAKKSELLRAGLHALMALDAQELVAALNRLQPLKVGRPKKGH